MPSKKSFLERYLAAIAIIGTILIAILAVFSSYHLGPWALSQPTKIYRYLIVFATPVLISGVFLFAMIGTAHIFHSKRLTARRKRNK